MWWPDFPRKIPSMTRLPAALALAGLTAGCFQPLYGDRAMVGGNAGVGDKLSSVDVRPVDTPNGTRLARVSVEIRNELIYQLTGGGPAAATNYHLDIKLSAHTINVIVDIHTARPDVQNYGIDASYTLTDITTGKKVVTARHSRACPTTFPASSSASPASAACAMPKTAPPR